MKAAQQKQKRLTDKGNTEIEYQVDGQINFRIGGIPIIELLSRRVSSFSR